MSLLDGRTMTVLTKALDAASVRHKAIANNIANVNTMDFKADRVLFEDELSRALRADQSRGNGLTTTNDMHYGGGGLAVTHDKHYGGDISLERVRPVVVKDESISMRVDENNVDIDLEMTNLAANQMMYEAVLRRINGKISSLKAVISGGR